MAPFARPTGADLAIQSADYAVQRRAARPGKRGALPLRVQHDLDAAVLFVAEGLVEVGPR